jgi:hypothetical protein
LGLEFVAEGLQERGKLFARFAFEDDGFGEEAVAETVAGGLRYLYAEAIRCEPQFIAAAITAVSVANAFQAVQPAPSAYERRGLYHATVHGRVVAPDGMPVGVHVELNAGRPRALPLVDVVTGPDGLFATPEVNSIYPPSLSWFPPEQWLDGGIPVVGESDTNIDVGVIQLTPARVIRVRVELVGGPVSWPQTR